MLRHTITGLVIDSIEAITQHCQLSFLSFMRLYIRRCILSTTIYAKSPDFSVEALCSHYLFSRLGQSIVLPSVGVRWTPTGRKKPRLFSRGLCSHYLFSRLGQLSFAVKKHAGGERPERCRWQIKRGKRLAAVGEGRRRISAEDIRRAPQQGCFRQRKASYFRRRLCVRITYFHG